MNSLFWKGMLAFLLVILVAVGTVALLTGRVTENAFRRYALTRSGMWEGLTTPLAEYYDARDSWVGIQEVLARWPDRGPRWRDRDRGVPVAPKRMIDFRIVDAQGQVVADTEGPPRGTVSQATLDDAVPIRVDTETVGHLLPALRNPPGWPLDAAQAAFLSRVRRTLWIGAMAALAVASIVGGLLFRSITAPLRELTAASEAIAKGDLSAQADVRGQDEVAQLAHAFNSMAKSLAHIEEARRNQTADIAHELRTPLTVLQGTLEAMLDGIYSTDRENLQAALIQTRTLSRLIEDLRLLALADAGKLCLEKSPLNLEASLAEAVEAYRPQAQDQGIALALEAPPGLARVSADRDRLTQVMGNLLSNALQYVPRGGHITVAAETAEREVLVAVKDDGPGVPPEDLPRLLERFWRADPARRRATGGSGLGLSIARYIVEAHGGRMRASETPGGGLTVTFTLPVASV
ncbi:MAG: ATP-binding protein [Anaerolineae bacterium]|jgi:signal transduction histidine kinase